MSARKSERLVNLLIALLSTRRYLTRQELRELVEGYRMAPSDAAFERQFERDKEELRASGIVIETGSNDPDSDEDDGYRVNRSEFELPPIEFTTAELGALGLAGQAWQSSVAAEHTAQAFEALRAAGASPDPALIPSVRPQVEVREPDFDVVYEAVLNRTQIQFGYAGQRRRLQPWTMVQRRGRWYVIGFDVDRGEDRRFKLARFTAPAETIGRAGAYSIPPEAKSLTVTRDEPTHAVVTVALHDDVAAEWRQATPVAWPHSLPDQFRAYEVPALSLEAAIDEVAGAGPDAILLAPSEARDVLIERLRRAAQ
ncbi:helix-turn-helix transcriptional regulator [Tessaracoccus flavus]|uniref:WYL domain-containing protein n=1 Tax=Tessaracoccus flavus TaxID=1610493 RepID=A0A1Q2CF87_9ACTN|nr:WYL domain-containing protein [Tessaracoccus flavus]AQP44757.1 hypothetical protein RPIT_08015 [Tessaracoccus flavus]SDZ16851.1 proteasome accessory factor B [Tessaracoccus flavus]